MSERLGLVTREDVERLLVQPGPDTEQLFDMAMQLHGQFKNTCSPDDFDLSIKVLKVANEDASEESILKGLDLMGHLLMRLGISVAVRFESNGSESDLDRAVEVLQKAMSDLLASRHHDLQTRKVVFDDMARISIKIALMLSLRYERTGSLASLEKAIESLGTWIPKEEGYLKAWDLRADAFNIAGHLIGIKYERSGLLQDLNDAIKAAEEAEDTVKPFKESTEYIEQAKEWKKNGQNVETADDILEASKELETHLGNKPNHLWPRIMANLGGLLLRRWKRTGDVTDAQRGLDATMQAMDYFRKFPADEDSRDYNHLLMLLSILKRNPGVMMQNTPGVEVNNFHMKFDAVVRWTQILVDALPQDHPDRPFWLLNLGRAFLARHSSNIPQSTDLEEALSAFMLGWSCRKNAQLSVCISAAWNAAQCLAKQSKWKASADLMKEASELFPAISPRSLDHIDKQHQLAEFFGMSSMAAATALQAEKLPWEALQLLESGRGVIGGLLMESRRDISDLQQQHPEQANEFILLREKLDHLTLTTPASGSSKTTYWESAVIRKEVEQKFSHVVTAIRSLPGFEDFLLPPTERRMMEAAELGPIIVINLSEYRCDAFLIEKHRITVEGLPLLTMKEVEERARNFRSSPSDPKLREWLWDTVCQPCLEALQLHHIEHDDYTSWPRVWWIPTGLLSQLPLHAAGYHGRGTGNTVIDRVMSSYASSIKTLTCGRRSGKKSCKPPGNAILLAMAETPGLSSKDNLQCATDEVKMLWNIFESHQVKPATPELCKDDVLAALQGCSVFHFAGHGESHPTEPSKSRLLLKDWETNPLTVGDLRDQRLHEMETPPFLAYLSACSTGANDVAKLADEGIHLVSAFQLAGFRHVIGTLIPVSDQHCVEMARIFYTSITGEEMDDLSVCRGLHRAARVMRNDNTARGGQHEERKGFAWPPQDTRGLLINNHWIPYVHFGV